MGSRKRIFYVYALLDPRKKGSFRYGRWVFDFEPFYVGKGYGDRHTDHFNELKRNTPRSAKIKKILRVTGDYPPSIIKRVGLTENQAFDLEIYLIKRIGRKDMGEGPLTNLTDGGDGLSGYVFSSEDRRRVREGLRNSPHHATHTKKVKCTWATKTPEEIQESVRKRIRTQQRNLDAMTEEERQKQFRQRSRAVREGKARARALLTPSQLAARSRKFSKRSIGMFDNMTPRAYNKFRSRISEASLGNTNKADWYRTQSEAR